MTDRTGYTIIIIAIAFLLSGCGSSEKISKKYYKSHSKSLNEINSAYSELYRQQPFVLLFTDTKYKKYSIEVSTDSIRYIYNTSIMPFSVADSVKRFGLSNMKIEGLRKKMAKAKCICVAVHSY